MMGADHGAVDHLQGVRHRPALVQSVHDVLPQPCQRPASELSVDARPLAKLFGQVPPGGARAGNPENPIENKTVVNRFAPVRSADRQDKTFKERPLLVRHQVSCQAGLHRRYQLESRLRLGVNPFCQHDLDAVSVQLQKIPGVGPIGVMALEAFAPPMQCFQSGRSFAAWLGLVPQQHSTGGKAKYGRASKMGQADIRRHLVAGAMSVIHWAKSRGFAGNTWLERLVGRKPTMVAAIALANKMARTIWAMLSTGEEYRMGGVAAA